MSEILYGPDGRTPLPSSTPTTVHRGFVHGTGENVRVALVVSNPKIFADAFLITEGADAGNYRMELTVPEAFRRLHAMVERAKLGDKVADELAAMMTPLVLDAYRSKFGRDPPFLDILQRYLASKLQKR